MYLVFISIPINKPVCLKEDMGRTILMERVTQDSNGDGVTTPLYFTVALCDTFWLDLTSSPVWSEMVVFFLAPIRGSALSPVSCPKKVCSLYLGTHSGESVIRQYFTHLPWKTEFLVHSIYYTRG